MDALYSTDRVTDYMKECEGLQSDRCLHAFEEAFIKIQALRSISDAEVRKNDVCPFNGSLSETRKTRETTALKCGLKLVAAFC